MDQQRIPAEVTHPSVFIIEELAARGWSIADLAQRMPGEYGINHLALDLYLTVGPDEPGARMGHMASEISTAFGVDEDFFDNLEKSWLDHPTTRAALIAAEQARQETADAD